MATIAMLHKIDGERVVEELNELLSNLDHAESEVEIDFSGVARLSPAALQVLGTLAAKSEEKGARVVLRGVNVDVYKELKLARLSGRFAFMS